jgi:predicted HAD superfamily Cof-like phosphohydrolase
MEAMGQPVRTTPTADLSDLERELRVRLVVEEALEFADAMGVRVTGIADNLHALNEHSVQVEVIPGTTVDIVEAADALADSLYVVHGSGHTLGIPLPRVFQEVHRSNMLKLDPVTGKPNVTPDGKVLKPEGWEPPRIAAALGVE